MADVSPPRVSGTGMGPRSPPTAPTVKGKGRAAVFCDVVVEGMSNSGGSWDVPHELTPLLGSLGSQLRFAEEKSAPDAGTVAGAFASTSKANSAGSIEKLQNLLRELVDTERSYVHRLDVLHNNYSKPLKSFARRSDTAIVSKFDANQMFNNVDRLHALNAQFLADFENCTKLRQRDWGVVIRDHMARFAEPTAYPHYLRNAEQGRETMRRLISKSKHSGLAEFADVSISGQDFNRFLIVTNPAELGFKRTKASSDASIDLSGLLMAPVQRVPLYILLLENMVRVLPKDSVNTPYLLEAISSASGIALCETTEAERKAAVMWSLQRTIDAFPPALYSSSRFFIDSIDVFDCPIPSTSRLHGPASKYLPMLNERLPCTLFLFSDTLLIAKRPQSSVGGKALAGLDDFSQLDRAFANAARSTPSKLKAKAMSYKGYVETADIHVSDVSSDEFYMYIPDPLQDQRDRWANRPLRRFIVDSSTTTESTITEKSRFFEQLWKSQSIARIVEGKSISMINDPPEGPVAFWNIYERRDYLMAKKAKIVLQLDAKGDSDELSLGIERFPDVIARVVYINENDVEYTIRDRTSNDVVLREITSALDIPHKTAEIILEYGLYEVPPRPQNSKSQLRLQVPGSSRSRPGQSTISTMSKQLFGGNNSHKRTRSAASKASTFDSNTTVSFASFGTRKTPSTAPTSVVSSEPGNRVLNKKRFDGVEHMEVLTEVSSSNGAGGSRPKDSAEDISATKSMPNFPSEEQNQEERASSAPPRETSQSDSEHDDDENDGNVSISPTALTRTPTRPRGPRQLGTTASPAGERTHQPNGVTEHSSSTSPSASMQYKSLTNDEAPVSAVSSKGFDALGKKRVPPTQKKERDAASQEEEDGSIRRVSGQKRGRPLSEIQSPTRKRPSYGQSIFEEKASDETSSPKFGDHDGDVTKGRFEDAEDDGGETGSIVSTAEGDVTLKSLKTIRELKSSLANITDEVMRETHKENDESLLTRSPAFVDLKRKTGVSEVGKTAGFHSATLDMDDLQKWLQKATAQVHDLEVRWMDQASKEEEIHNGVYALTDRLTKSEDDKKELERTVEQLRNREEEHRRLQDETDGENMTLYESFNQELERLFEEACLPDGDAYRALSEHVKRAKSAQKAAEATAGALRRDFQRQKLQLDEALKLLKENGLSLP